MNNWSAAAIGLIAGAGIAWAWIGTGGRDAGDAGKTPAPPAGAARQEAAKETVESFFLTFPDDGVALTNDGSMFLKPFPEGIPRFEEPAIRTSMGILAKVRNRQGEVIGFASELEVFPPDMAETFMTGKAVWDTVWTVVIPGRGAVFLVEQEQSGSFAAEIMGPALETGESWQGEYDMTTSVGPGSDGRGLIVGGSGAFAGARGAFIERNHFTEFDPAGPIRIGTELRLFFTAPPAAGRGEGG